MRPIDRIDVPALVTSPGFGLPVFLTDQAVLREPRRDSRPQNAFHLLISVGHERAVRLAVDHQLIAERTEGDLVGLVHALEGETEPVGKLVRRAAPTRGRPFSTQRLEVVHQARILAPSGSHMGSRTISKPTHSPKMSISPRVPIAAPSGGRYA